MPSPTPTLAIRDIEGFLREHRLGSTDSGRVGVEIEWLTFRADNPVERVTPEQMVGPLEKLGGLPSKGTVTFEPGGQLELSTIAHHGIANTTAALAGDRAAIQRALAAHGIELVSIGFDPVRPMERVLDAPRYQAMERHFDAAGVDGRSMMCGTAAIQVSVDFSGSTSVEERWRLAHQIGPVVAAAFANSPLRRSASGKVEPSGFRSTRLATWAAVDSSRASPVLNGNGNGHAGDSNLASSWLRYALDAQVMLIRSNRERYEPIIDPLPFRRWIEQGHELGYPTLGDFEYHLTTLFPPVRPSGRLELRMIDTVGDPWWRAAVALVTAMLDDGEAAEVASRSIARGDVRAAWDNAALHALDHPVLGRSALKCFDAALDALPRLGADKETLDASAEFVDRYVARGRCPADDLLDTWRRGESLAATFELGS